MLVSVLSYSLDQKDDSTSGAGEARVASIFLCGILAQGDINFLYLGTTQRYGENP